MRKLPRSLRLYVAASTLYAALIFFAVQFIYTIELAQSGIVIARRDNGDLLSSIQLVSFIVWLGTSLIAAVVLHRLATALAGAKSAEAEAKTSEEQKDQELGAIFGLSSALAGPLDLEQIGAFFVAAVRGALPLDTTIALIVYDDVLEAFRTVAADGPLASELKDRHYSAVALPSIVRVRVIDHRQSLVIADTSADAAMWAKGLGRDAGVRECAILRRAAARLPRAPRRSAPSSRRARGRPHPRQSADAGDHGSVRRGFDPQRSVGKGGGSPSRA